MPKSYPVEFRWKTLSLVRSSKSVADTASELGINKGSLHAWVNQDELAIKIRTPSADSVIHSDHGVQFTSWVFTSKIKEAGLLPSLGTVRDAYDNAMMESFWSKMQTELFNRKRWNTRVDLVNEMFKYLEIFHNRQRRHSQLDSQLGYLTPVEYKRMHLESNKLPKVQ